MKRKVLLPPQQITIYPRNITEAVLAYECNEGYLQWEWCCPLASRLSDLGFKCRVKNDRMQVYPPHEKSYTLYLSSWASNFTRAIDRNVFMEDRREIFERFYRLPYTLELYESNPHVAM